MGRENRIIIKSDEEARGGAQLAAVEATAWWKGQCRRGKVMVILPAFEAKLGAMLAADEPIPTYIPDPAMYLINRLKVWEDSVRARQRQGGVNTRLLVW